MKLEVHISKKYFFILLGSILILMGMLGVLAFNSGGPPGNTGHSWEEIESPEQANRWTDWEEIGGTIPLQATRWAEWGEITNIPSDIANGDDVGGNQFQYKSCSSSPCNLGFSPSFVIVDLKVACGPILMLEDGDSASQSIDCGSGFPTTFTASLSGQILTWSTGWAGSAGGASVILHS